MTQTAIATNSLRAWILASRPKTLGAISCPLLMGNALAYQYVDFSWQHFVVMMIDGLLLQILVNVVNDYGDFMKGSDQDDRLGPPRAMQMGWISKNAMLIGIAVLLFLSGSLGLFLVYAGGPIIFVLGALALLLCLAYTLGPMPLAYLGFAEVIIFFVFGPIIVLGSFFVQTHTITTPVVVSSLSPGFLAAALLLTNNLRDTVQDRRNNKRTTAVRLGEKAARALIIALLCATCLGPMLLVVYFSFSPLILLSCFALVLPAQHVVMIARAPISARFNLMLAAIGKALYWFGVIFCVGLLYGAP